MTKHYNQQVNRTGSWLKLAAVCMVLMLGMGTSLKAQLTGTKNIPGDYADLAAAITDLNTAGVGATGVTLNLLAGNPQTAPAGGYAITTLTGSVTNPITITGNGNTITSSAALVAGSLNDALFKVIGTDYVTIQNFTLVENAANTVTAAATNTMTEWGIAVLYATATDGAQNCVIQNNTITLNRTYQNTFGIYVSSVHTAAAPTTTATASSPAGSNSSLRVYGNTISNVNNGICVVGPNGAANHNDGIDIGGTSMVTGNTISNFGTTGTFSGFVGVYAATTGIQVKNSKNVSIGYNSITSSTGGVTAGAHAGIVLQTFNNAPTGTFTNTISNNTLALQSANAGGGIIGIDCQATTTNTTGSTLTINANNFTAIGHSVAGTGAITVINSASAALNTNINNNTFTNITTNTTGSFTFINNNVTRQANAVTNVNNNSIVTAFSKTGAGGTVRFYDSFGTTPASGTEINNGNNFSNITLTGATVLDGWRCADGPIGGAGPIKTFNNNTFSGITVGTSSITSVATVGYSTSGTVTGNTFSNISGASNMNIFVCPAGTQNWSGNDIHSISSTGTGLIAAFTISGGANQNFSKNKIYDISGSNAGSTVTGLSVTGGTTTTISNNVIGDLRAPAATADNVVRGISLTGGTNNNVYYNTVYLSATGVNNFGSSALHSSSGTLDLRNNILINKSTPSGTGLVVALRRASTALTTYAAASNNNILYAGVPAANRLIYYDGTNSDQTLAAFKTRVSTRETNSQTQDVAFLSLSGASANFLHVNTAVPTYAESGAANIATYVDDIDGNIRFGNPGYAGTSTTAPDIGADEFDGTVMPNCSGTPVAGTIGGAATVCSGTGTSLSVTGATSDIGITYQWQSSATPGGPYTNMGTVSSQATGNLTVPTYYIAIVGCSFSGMSDTTAEYVVNITTAPAVAVTPNTGAICLPTGGNVVLTASNATTYTWTPSAGLSATSGATVTATPTVSTTYTVTGTDGSGCSATATATISVGTSPIITSATATPASVCSGGNSQLTANSTSAANTVSTYSFSATSGTYTPITGTTLGAAAIGDDVGIGNLPIGFPFSYNGNYFTVFGARSNGLIELGQTGATLTGFSANDLDGVANCIAPLWDDNNTAGGSIIYATTGVAPNRILTVQWTAMHVGNGGSSSAATSTIDMQLKLYEADGTIQFIYGSTSGALNTTTATIGISGAVANFKSVTPLLPVGNSTVSSVTENTNINSATNFPSGTTYTFGYTTVTNTNTYAWSPATYLNNTAIQSPMASGIMASTVYTVTVSSAIGCVGNTATVSITAGSPLTASASVAPNDTVCEGTNITLQSVPAGGGAPYTYAWTGPNSFSSTAQNPVINAVTVAGEGTYSVTVTDACGANVSTTVDLEVSPSPALTVTPSSGTICLPGGAAVSLTASGTAVSYAWLPTTGLTPSTGATVSANPTASTNYTVTGTGANGCTTTATASITVNSTPIVSSVTATPANLCTGGNSQLNAVVTVGASVIITEVTLYSGGTGATSPYPAYITGADLVEISNISASPVDISGYKLMDYASNSSTPTHPFTFPAGTIIPPNGVSVVNLGSGTDNIANRYFNTGGGSDTYSSGGLVGIVLMNGAVIVDAVGVNSGYVFNAATGVTATDWSGFASSPSSMAGTIRSATTDHNTGADWIQSNTPSPLQTIGTYNGGYIAPAAPIYSWMPATFLSDPAIANPVATAVTANTTYTVTVSTPSGCSATGTVSLNVDPMTAVTVGATPTTLCAGGSTAITATPVGGGAPFTYSWMPGGATTNTITANPSVTTDYTVTVTDNCGTMLTNTISIVVNPLPAVTASATATSYCTPGSPAIAITAGGADTYTWLPAAGLDVTTGSAVNATPSNSTTYTVTGTDAVTGCINTATVTISAVPAVTGVTAAVSDAVICAGDTIDLTGSAASLITLYTENFNGATNSWTISNSNTGTNQAQQGWNLYTPPYTPGGAWTGAVSNLDGSQFYMTNSDVSGTGGTTLSSLTSPRIDASSMSTLSLSFEHFYKYYSGTDNGQVQVSTNGTTFTTIQTYTANVNLQATWAPATFNLNAYAGSDTVYIRFLYTATWDFGWGIDNLALTGATSAVNYAWTSSPAGFTSAVQNPVDVVPAASTTYSVVVSNAFGCSSSATASVTVNARPVVTLGNDTAVCSAGLPLTLDAGNAGAAYMWSTTAATQTIAANAAGSYNVAVTDANGCVGRDTIAISINASPVVALGTDTVRCGGTVTLDAGNAGATYAWSDMTSNQTTTVTASGTYDVVVTNANGCEGFDTIMVTINTVPTVALGNDTLVCGTNVTLDAGNAGATYLWNTTEATQTINVTTGGQYFVEVTTPQNCSSRDTINVTVAPAVVVNLGNDSAICTNASLILDAQNPGATYVWNDNSTASILTITGPGTYAVVVTSAAGCEGQDTIVFTDNSPSVTLSLPFTTTCENTAVNPLSGGSPAGGFYSGTGVTGTNFNAGAAGPYLISYTYTDGTTGCSATDTQTVVVDPCIGIKDLGAVASLSVAPNPTTGHFSILSPSRNNVVKAEMYTVEGQLIYSETLKGREEYEMNITNLANAIYYLRLTVDGETNVVKVVKQQ